jgi:cytoskeletal protein RodZ
VQLGRGLPKWRLNGDECHRNLQHCQPEVATNHTLAFDRPANSEPSHNNHTTTDIPLSLTPTLKPTEADSEADGDVLDRTGCGGQADNQPRANVVDAQDRNQNQRLGPRQEAAGQGRQQESVDDRERTKQCKNRRKKELRRRQMMKVTEPAEEERVASSAAAAEGGSRVVSLAAYEWVRIESRGVLWVEEGPARLVLRPGERIASGPHQRLDLPTAAATPFFWSGSGELCV